MDKTHLKFRRRSGQAVVEYVLLIVVITGFLVFAMKPMKNLLRLLEVPLRKDFRYTYKYGDPKTCGYEDEADGCSGSPSRHPRIVAPGNLRMFGRK